MTAIVDGLYKQGQLELLQTPHDLPDGRVRVILIAEEHVRPPSCPLTFGKYQSGRLSTLEDFKAGEWHGEAEFDPSHGS